MQVIKSAQPNLARSAGSILSDDMDSFRDRYVELAADFQGTKYELTLMLRGYVRQWARAMIRTHPLIDRAALADAFAGIATHCLRLAREQKWAHAHHLEIDQIMRNSVRELQI